MFIQRTLNSVRILSDCLAKFIYIYAKEIAFKAESANKRGKKTNESCV